MDVFEVLKKDHQEAREMFKKIEGLSAGAKKTREDVYGKLKQELLRHALAEEKAFYPQFRQQRETHDLVEEGYSEHDHVKKMLKKIDAMPVDSDDWMDAIRDLKEAVEHHVKEEENELFPKIRKMIEKDRAEELAEQVQQAKKQEAKKH